MLLKKKSNSFKALQTAGQLKTLWGSFEKVPLSKIFSLSSKASEKCEHSFLYMKTCTVQFFRKAKLNFTTVVDQKEKVFSFDRVDAFLSSHFQSIDRATGWQFPELIYERIASESHSNLRVLKRESGIVWGCGQVCHLSKFFSCLSSEKILM